MASYNCNMIARGIGHVEFQRSLQNAAAHLLLAACERQDGRADDFRVIAACLQVLSTESSNDLVNKTFSLRSDRRSIPVMLLASQDNSPS